MLTDESVVVESSWVGADEAEAWRDLDRQLCSIARRRGALDQEELMLIREAVAVQLWRPLGMTSMREYLEHRLGYGPQVAAERLRVAEALDAMPEIDDALAAGELSYSAVRELTRIATPKTAGAWVKACRGKVLRQIEELVAEREPGDPPESKPKPQVRPRRFAADLRPDVHALVRQARQVLESEYGEKLDNDELMAAFAARVLEGAPARGKVQRPRHQIAAIVCAGCGQGWQTGAGREIPISALDVEVALCDAQSVDEHGKLTQAIPAARRRAVWRRDHGRCTIPGCRASCFIDVHHLVPRAHGGTHEMSNLALLCAGHHRALHAGLIVIEGVAPDFRVIRVSAVPHVGEPCSVCPSGSHEPMVAADPACLDEMRASNPHAPMVADDPACIDEMRASGPHAPMVAADPACIDVVRASGPHAPMVADDPACIDEVRASGPHAPMVADDPACIDEMRASGPHAPMVAADTACTVVRASAPREPTATTAVGAVACIDEARRSNRRGDIHPHEGDLRRMASDVEAGLVRLGFRRAEARDAVDRARARGATTDVEALMRAALRECPRPTS